MSARTVVAVVPCVDGRRRPTHPELERGFRRDGLPNLIVDLSATEDIFTRAIPFLTLVFVVEAKRARRQRR